MASDLMAVVAIAKKAEEANRGKEEEETRLAVVVCVFLTVILRDSDNNDHAKLQHYFHQLSLFDVFFSWRYIKAKQEGI